ncbi:hypothetical protein [Mesorhizobium sp. SP-1A]|uniref:hypothetical protein n=1 Tax=Mesorhizobium sp. SP-1A TaxID=3077840 RepID=UPI0028F6CF82|nr:hypothetical protein [Mesorhizobium sp. SP-1A]
MSGNQISLLEGHGFNSNIFLFGSANSNPTAWLGFNLDTIGGIVATIHFSAPNLSGRIAVIASESPSLETLSCPSDGLFIQIERNPERSHIKSLSDGMSRLSHPMGHLEASFIGGGYHLDFIRGNFATFENSDTQRFPPLSSPPALESSIRHSPTNGNLPRIKSKVQEAKFGVKISGVEGLIISVAEDGQLLIAHDGSIHTTPTSATIDRDGLHAHSADGDLVFSVFSPELFSKTKTPLSESPYFVAFDGKEILEWRELKVAE